MSSVPDGGPVGPDEDRAAALRSVEAAALAGLAFAVLFVVARMLLLRSPTPSDPDLAAWYADGDNQRSLVTALNLTAVAAIAFLWFVAVIRRRAGDHRFFGAVFLGSALLAAGTWTVGALLYVTPALTAYLHETTPSASEVAAWQAAGESAFSVLSIRFQSVFLVSTTTVGRLAGVFPRLLVVAGYGAGLVLLLTPVLIEGLALVFPAWVAVVSCVLLVRRGQVASVDA